MRSLFGILPLVAGSLAGTTHTYEKVVERDVVVIGGGSSGTYSAVSLLDKGVSVVVLEKENHLGGHTVTYTDPDTHQPFNLGVIVFHNSSVVRNYFDRFHVALTNADLSGGLPSSYYDFSTGAAVTDYKPVSEQALGAAIQKYAGIIATKYPYLSLGYDLPSPVPEELLQPYSQFIKKYDLGDIVQTVNNIAGCNGHLLKRPALYAIKVFNLLLVEALSKGFLTAASGDNRALYRAAEKLLEKKDSVVYNSKIKKIKRSSEGVLVWVNTPGQQVLVKAKKLILAIPPLKKNLEAIGLDLTTEEANLASKFIGYLYGSAVFEYKGLSAKKTLDNVGATTPSHLLTLPGLFNVGPLIGRLPTNKFSTYYCGLNPDASKKEIKTLIGDQLHNLEKKGHIGPGKVNYKYFGDHAPYHIHVSTDDVKNGFYKKFSALEGKRNTFWTGAAFVDNDSTLIWTWSESYLLPLIFKSLKS